MKKPLLMLCAGLLLAAAAANAAKPKLINTTVDLSEGNYGPPLTSSLGTVSIGTVTIDRTLPAAAVDSPEPDPQYAAQQIGYYRKSYEYLVVLKNKTNEQFVREAVALALSQAGYAVVSNAAAADKTVDVKVSELWMWVTPMPDNRDRKQFYFAMTTEFSSDDKILNGIGAVAVNDFRNGSRDTNWKSYRNTIMHSMKGYLANFNQALELSRSAANKAAAGQSQGSVTSLSQRLEELTQLRDSGVLTEDEYTELRSKVIAESLE